MFPEIRTRGPLYSNFDRAGFARSSLLFPSVIIHRLSVLSYKVRTKGPRTVAVPTRAILEGSFCEKVEGWGWGWGGGARWRENIYASKRSIAVIRDEDKLASSSGTLSSQRPGCESLSSRAMYAIISVTCACFISDHLRKTVEASRAGRTRARGRSVTHLVNPFQRSLKLYGCSVRPACERSRVQSPIWRKTQLWPSNEPTSSSHMSRSDAFLRIKS